MIIIKKYCKTIDITDRTLISKATYKCLSNKYKRNDTLNLFSDISGLSKNQIYYIYKHYGKKTLFPIVEVLIDIIQTELLKKDIHFIPIWYKDKVDPSSGKIRHIGIQNVKQQIYDYIAIEGLKPFFCRIGVHQYASIKGRGQIAGARQISRWMRNKSLKYYAKLDIKKCYPSIPQDKLMQFLSKHIKNNMLLWLIQKLIETFDEGGLSIGSYLSQFLCNLYLSQLYHNIGHYHKIRKHKNGTIENVRLVSHRLFYMDDILFLGTSLKNIQQAIKYIIKDAAEIGLKIKETWFTRKISWKDRKHETDFIDMMGIRIYRTHLTIRKRVFKRIRRVCIRLYRFWKLHQKIPIHLARKAISYYGLIKNTNSYKIKKKYHVNKIIQLSKGVIRNESTFYVGAAFCQSY